MALVAERLESDVRETVASRLYGMESMAPRSSTSSGEGNPIISYYHNAPVITGGIVVSLDETRPNQLRQPGVLNDQLSDLAQLPDDWDGDGGLPTTREAVATARRILRVVGLLSEQLGTDLSVDPLPNGGIDMEWVSHGGNQLLAEVHPNGSDISIAVCTKNRLNGKLEYWSDRLFDFEQLLPLLLWLDR